MNNDIRFSMFNTSIAHTYGNVLASIQKYILNKFEDKFFKTIHVQSRLAHRQLKSTPSEFLKKRKPAIAFRPRIDYNDNNAFLSNTLATKQIGDVYSSYNSTNLEPFIVTDTSECKWKLNTDSMNIDVIMVFSTYLEQLNFAKYVEQIFMPEVPTCIETYLESYIPMHIIEYYVTRCPYTLESDTDIIKYLNSISLYPITYKLQGSTGKKEYFRYYKVYLNCMVSNFNVDDGEKANQITKDYQITFTMNVNFFTTGFYYLFTTDNFYMRDLSIPETDDKLTTIFTDILVSDDINLNRGWVLYAEPSCMLSDYDDELDISSIFNNSIKKCIDYALNHGLPIIEFLDIKIRAQGDLLHPDKFKIDYKELKIYFKNCDVYLTYKILVNLNTTYINETIKSEYGLE